MVRIDDGIMPKSTDIKPFQPIGLLMLNTRFLLSVLAASLVMGAGTPLAQSAAPKSGDLIPPSSTVEARLDPLDAESHPPLKLTPDKSELVRLNTEAASVIVGNPEHITVLLDTPKLAVIVPRRAGATYFTVLDKDQNVIMQRHVIVSSPQKNYVRIRRSCAAAPKDSPCEATSVYFCPDMCHEIGAGGGENANE